MTIDEAAHMLSKICRSAPEEEKVGHVHLFGIRYAAELENLPLYEIDVHAGLATSWATEINRGRSLARIVRLRSD